MQRDIDFKLWDPEKKLMLNCYEILFVAGGIKTSDGCTTEGWYKVNEDFKEKLSPSLILLEFTGFTDSTGKKIYEGDILRLGEAVGCCEYPVMYERGTFYTTHFSDFDPLYKVMGDRNVYVIGNIYENPDILEED